MPLKLHHLHLKNFRAFADLKLDLHEEVTLLVGLNASGKTAILDALAVALGGWMRGTAQMGKEDRSINKSDARLVRQDQTLATVNPTFPVAVEAKGTVSGQRVTWLRELRRIDGRTTTGDAREVRKLAAALEQDASEHASVELPLLAYFGTGRRWVEKRDRSSAKEALGSRMQGYAACLEMASQTKLFEEWMHRRTSDRLQRLDAIHETGGDPSEVRSPHLDAVSAAAKGVLAGINRFFYSLNHGELRVELDDGRLLPFDLLSDGQRSLVTMAAELAWRAAQLNPHHGRDAPARTQGVVLVDEIELHLHPGWQRTVLERLRETFPRVQWILTTHSPQVLASAHSDWVRVLLPDHRIGRVGHTFGRDSNAILQQVMGVPPRPAWMEAKLGEVEALIDEERIDEARPLLGEIREHLGEDDATVLALDWAVREAESHDADD